MSMLHTDVRIFPFILKTTIKQKHLLNQNVLSGLKGKNITTHAMRFLTKKMSNFDFTC